MSTSTKADRPPKPAASSLPSPIRHSHTLSDGRLLSYYTFATGVDQSELPTHHPILYFHGFPGSGVEGAIHANAATKAKCRVFAIDRPGFGRSSPSPAADWNDPDKYMQSFVSDVWDFVEAMGWTDFSIDGVSGGGAYSLAILDSYLKSKLGSDNCKDTTGSTEGPAISCHLEAVSLVAGIFCPAGTDGMFPPNKKLASIASLRGWKSSAAYFGLLLLASVQRFVLLQILLRFVSEKKLLKLASSSAMKDLPEVDRNAFADDEAVGLVFLNDVKEALRQAAGPLVLEAKVLFREKYYFEESLRDNWAKMNNAETKKSQDIPRVTLFQGNEDVNVPPAHAHHVYERIFGGKACSSARLVEFADMGHLSLIVKKADAILESAARK